MVTMRKKANTPRRPVRSVVLKDYPGIDNLKAKRRKELREAHNESYRVV